VDGLHDTIDDDGVGLDAVELERAHVDALLVDEARASSCSCSWAWRTAEAATLGSGWAVFSSRGDLAVGELGVVADCGLHDGGLLEVAVGVDVNWTTTAERS